MEFTRIPMSELTTPRAGKICLTDAWWAVTADNEVLFYGTSPQCNRNKAVIERIRPEFSAVYVPVAYVPHRCADYC